MRCFLSSLIDLNHVLRPQRVRESVVARFERFLSALQKLGPVPRIGRIGRGVSVSAGATAGAVVGAGLGVYVGIVVFFVAWDFAGGAGFYFGFLGGFPLCVLGGAVLGARLFLRFRGFANRLRLRHRRVGVLAWGLGSVVLAFLAAVAAGAEYDFFQFLFD